jgi:hypothetical protein
MIQTACPSCEREIDHNAMYCGYCGFAIEPIKNGPVAQHGARSQSEAGIDASKKKVGKLDRIVFVAFRLGKVIAVVMTLLFFLVFLASGVTLALTGQSTFKTPHFSDTHFSEPSETGGVKTDTSGIKERQDVERRFGDRLRRILENYSLAANGYDILVGWTIAVPTDHREQFVHGMESFMADGVAYGKSIGKQADTSELIALYNRMFGESLEGEATAIKDALQTRLITMAVLAGSALLFFVFLVIPALLQIEKNTRVITA